MTAAAAAADLAGLKRAVAGVLARSKLDYTDNVLILNAFLRDFRWVEGRRPLEVRRHWEAALEGGEAARRGTALYIHVPYCRKKCHFCYCSVKASPSAAALEGYVPALEAELDFFAPLFRGRPMRLFQVGGGTPNLLSAAQLSRLLGAALERFSFEEGCLRTIEFNPAGADEARLRAAREAGFNRASFGVQSLNPDVLEKENREYQDFAMLERAVGLCRRLGFDVVNVDLLLGLEGEDAESFLDGFKRAADLAPTSITVTGLTLTDAYLKVTGTNRERKLRFYERLLPKAVAGVRRLAREAGYDASFVGPELATWIVYRPMPAEVRERLTRGDRSSGGKSSILGLGPLAWSHVYGRAICERNGEPFAAGAPLYRVVPMGPKEEMAQHILYCLEYRSRVEWAEFSGRFGEDARRRFARELAALEALGRVKRDARGFSFLPRRGPERIFYGLFFLLDFVAQSSLATGDLRRLWPAEAS